MVPFLKWFWRSWMSQILQFSAATSSLSHFVYSWQEPKQNADCQKCTGQGMLFSAHSFISCSQLEDAELSLSTPEESPSEAVTEISPAWFFWHDVRVLFLAVLSPPHFPPLRVSVLFWHWSCSSTQTRSCEPTQCEVGAANCAIKSIK